MLEAAARKPGNVHPWHSFRDLTFGDFVRSAQATAEPLSRSPERPLGETILAAVEATSSLVGSNSNLGIVLLLAPLAAAPLEVLRGSSTQAGRGLLAAWLEEFLARLSRRDAELTYAAIRRARPGSLGAAREGDVASGPTGTLLEMMRLAAHVDLVARQYATAFEEVIHFGLPGFGALLGQGIGLEEAIVGLALQLLARNGDTLIGRKRGAGERAEAARRAAAVLEAGWPTSPQGAAALVDFDDWLRAEGNSRNPGTTADLVAAVLFLAVASGIIQLHSPQPLALLNRMHKYKVRVTKDYLTFCSAHFISFEGTQCERLHGHNYRVSAEIEAPLNDDFLVFDFIVLKQLLREISNELDHRMLVPLRSKALRIQVSDQEVEISYNTKRWLFPREDCALLEIENTTAELLARWFSERLKSEMARQARSCPSPARLPEIVRVEVEESPGQSATYETAG